MRVLVPTNIASGGASCGTPMLKLKSRREKNGDSCTLDIAAASIHIRREQGGF